MQMISTFKLPVPGGFLVTGYYRDCSGPRIIGKFRVNEKTADGAIKEIKRDAIQEKVKRLLNHRSILMDSYGALRTNEKLKIIYTLRANFNNIKDKSLEYNCRLILNCEDLFTAIMPGKSSIYYRSTKEIVTEIISFCKMELTVKL